MLKRKNKESVSLTSEGSGSSWDCFKGLGAAERMLPTSLLWLVYFHLEKSFYFMSVYILTVYSSDSQVFSLCSL